MIMGTAMMETGMMNTGRMTTGVTATGLIIPMDTTAYTLSGGIRGGGIGSCCAVTGVIPSRGISSTLASTLSGMTVVIGGIDLDTDVIYDIDCRMRMVRYGVG